MGEGEAAPAAHATLAPDAERLLDALERALLVADGHGRVIYASPRAEVRVARTRASLLGARVSDVLEATPPIAIRPVHLAGAGAVTLFELAELADGEGVAGGLAGHVLEVALAQSATGTELADLEGRILWVNRAFTKLTGYAFDEIVGRMAAVLRTADADPALYAGIIATVRSGASFRGEVRRRRKDGSSYDARLTVSPVLDARGAILCLVAHHEDISEAKALELKVLRAERLASVGQLAAGLAHEVNSPLTYVMANLELGLERLAEAQSPASPELSEMMRAAYDGAARVRDIVRGVRLFSRVDATSERTAVSLAAVVDDALTLTENDLRHRARVVRHRGPVIRVHADRARLAQVFVNLLVNAAQALPLGRAHANTVTVTTSVDAAGRAVAEVRDTGPGIPPNIIERIFEPFFTTKAVGEGMGLGLAICQGIVQELGGELVVESLVGAGTNFRVTLPAAESGVATPSLLPHAASIGAPGSTERLVVLVIDDDSGVRFAVERLLSFVEVLSASSGAEALACLERRADVDVVLCDLMMPEMCGWELYDRLVVERPAVAARMVFFSGGAFSTAARAFLERVENPRMEKPFTATELRHVVREVAARHPRGT